MNNKNIILVIYGVLTLCSGVAISIVPSNLKTNMNETISFWKLLRNELGEIKVEHVLAMLLILLIYKRQINSNKYPDNKCFSKSAFVIGFIYSIFIICGMSLSAFHSLDFILLNKNQMMIAFIVFTGLWGIFYVLVKEIILFIDYKNNIPVIKFNNQFFEKHFGVICTIIMLAGWLVFAIPFFPGSVPHDGRNQLNMYFGYGSMNLHHPYYSTIILGTIFKIGENTGGGHAGGCIAYNAFQSVFGAIVFGEICKYIYGKLKNKYIAVIVLIFYSAAPMWWTYMQALIKDSLCFIVFAWFILELVKVYFGGSGRMGYARMIIAGVLTALLRNGMSLIIIPAVFVLLFAVKDKRKIFISMTGIIILIVLFHYFPENILGLKPGNQVEDKSIPLQQIARTVTFFEDEFTDEDKEIIN